MDEVLGVAGVADHRARRVVDFETADRRPRPALLDEAEAILSRCESLKERAGALSGVAQTQLALAVEDAVPLAMLAPVLARLPARYPGVRLNLLQPCTKSVLEMVLDGEAEFALGCTRANYPAHIGFCRLGHVTLMNVAHRDHPLARMEGTTGQVEVKFVVEASGATSNLEITGPDRFKEAARQTVGSWTFRRTSTERLFLVTTIEYGAESAHAAVKRQS